MVCSKNNKIVHSNNCHYINMIHKENIDIVDIYSAHSGGYVFCKRCDPMKRIYDRNKGNVDKFMASSSYEYRIDNGKMFVTNIKESWIIITDGTALLLFHKNRNEIFANFNVEYVSNLPLSISGYHFQKRNFRSLMKCLKYIRNHELFRRNEKRKSKKSGFESFYEEESWSQDYATRKCKTKINNKGSVQSRLKRKRDADKVLRLIDALNKGAKIN